MNTISSDQIDAIVTGVHTRPFDVLGVQRTGTEWVVRSFQPNASSASLLLQDATIPMVKIHDSGLFEAVCANAPEHYRLGLRSREHNWTIVDAYGFETSIGDLDYHLFNEGTHTRLYELLGANPAIINRQRGIRFSVWAPNAKLVSLIGTFNDWDRRRHVMRHHSTSGLWDIFIPDVPAGAMYKFELLDQHDNWLPLKSDPYGRACEAPPGNASIVFNSEYQWRDENWQQLRTTKPDLLQPVSIYEVHAGSWRWDDGRKLSYRELADQLIPYVLELGFTHLELMPITEHPFTASWGYQPTGMFAPTERFGNPDDFRYFVDRCHQASLAVIMDWVPAHFPKDAHGLALFDGTHLYEHADPRQGVHQDWDTLIYNFGRNEVANFLLSNALYWIREFHLDGLRVDAVASMLYLDYSRDHGEWIPNRHGGNQNLEAIDILQRINEHIHAEGGFTLAEESTSFEGVSRPVFLGGLGFTYKWNMGWMHDVLEYMQLDAIHRKHHQNKLTFGLVYAFTENFTLPLSHDEVVHGKGSMLGKMTGDPWQAMANLRSCYSFMFGYPGKKLLFMGNEFAQAREWSHDRELDWNLLDDPAHKGIQLLVKRLNQLYRSCPALHVADCDSSGFEWIDCDNTEQSVLSWFRHGHGQSIIVVCNLMPVVRENYRIGVDLPGRYREVFNSDMVEFGGSGIANSATNLSNESKTHGRSHTIVVTLPPLAALFLEKEPTTQ